MAAPQPHLWPGNHRAQPIPAPGHAAHGQNRTQHARQARGPLHHFSAREYVTEFGYTRDERADNLYADMSDLFQERTSRLAFVPSQTQIGALHDPPRYTLRVRRHAPAPGARNGARNVEVLSCSCLDFQNNTFNDDSFECKHMLAFAQFITDNPHVPGLT